MPSKKAYDLVPDDGYDSRIPLHNDEAFQHGLQFQAKYIGTLDVPRPSSRVEIVAAMRRIRYEFKAKAIKKQKVILTVSVDGVKVTLRKKKKSQWLIEETRLVIMHHPIYRIFYVSHDSQDLKIWSYIARDGPSNVFKCNVFKAYKKSQAMRIVRTIGQAFEVCHKLGGHSSSRPCSELKDDGSEGQDMTSSAKTSPARQEQKELNTSTSGSSPFGSPASSAEDSNSKEKRSKQKGSPSGKFSLNNNISPKSPSASQLGDNSNVDGSNTFSMDRRSQMMPLSHHHQIQLLRQQLEQQQHQLQVAIAQVHLLKDQLSAETAARIESQARTHQLLLHNKDLLDHVSLLVSRVQDLEVKVSGVVLDDEVSPGGGSRPVSFCGLEYNTLYNTTQMLPIPEATTPRPAPVYMPDLQSSKQFILNASDLLIGGTANVNMFANRKVTSADGYLDADSPDSGHKEMSSESLSCLAVGGHNGNVGDGGDNGGLPGNKTSTNAATAVWLNPYGFFSSASVPSPHTTGSTSSNTMVNTSSSSSQESSYPTGVARELDMGQPGGWLVNLSARSVSASPISSTHSKSSTIKASSCESNTEDAVDGDKISSKKEGRRGKHQSPRNKSIDKHARKEVVSLDLGDYSSSPFSSFSSDSSSQQLLSSMSSTSSRTSVAHSMASSQSSQSVSSAGGPQTNYTDRYDGQDNKSSGPVSKSGGPIPRSPLNHNLPGTNSQTNPSPNLHKSSASGNSPQKKAASDRDKLISPLQSPRRRMGLSLSSLPPTPTTPQQHLHGHQHCSPSAKTQLPPPSPSSSSNISQPKQQLPPTSSSPQASASSLYHSSTSLSPKSGDAENPNRVPPSPSLPTMSSATPKIDPPPKYRRSGRHIERWERGSWYGAPLTASNVDPQIQAACPPSNPQSSPARNYGSFFPTSEGSPVGKSPSKHRSLNNVNYNGRGYTGSPSNTPSNIAHSKGDNTTAAVVMRSSSKTGHSPSYRNSTSSSTISYREAVNPDNIPVTSPRRQKLTNVEVNDLNSSPQYRSSHNHYPCNNSNPSGVNGNNTNNVHHLYHMNANNQYSHNNQIHYHRHQQHFHHAYRHQENPSNNNNNQQSQRDASQHRSHQQHPKQMHLQQAPGHSDSSKWKSRLSYASDTSDTSADCTNIPTRD